MLICGTCIPGADIFGWTSSLADFPLVPPFSANPGLTFDLPAAPTPYTFFEHFFDRDMLLNIRRETNRYAAQQILAQTQQGRMKQHSLLGTWRDVSLPELKRFFAIVVHMGVVRKPSLNDYWSTNPVLRSSFAPQLMSRDRFKTILQALHLNDNTNYIPRGNENHDPMFKLQPVYSVLNQKYQTSYVLSSNVAIDEAMCPFKGRVPFRVYMPNKPHKWGMKIYEVCESHSGYIWSYELHCGVPGISYSPSQVVLRLAHPLKDQGYTLFMDNYYTCPSLFDALTAMDIMAVGTVRGNRKEMPVDFKGMHLAAGKLPTGVGIMFWP